MIIKKQLSTFLILGGLWLGLPQTTSANDFPTQTRVEFVLQCMDQQGGKSYQTLYPCVCMIDKIAQEISHDDFAQAQTFTYLKSTPGERGGLFRDPPQAKALRDQLKKAKEKAQTACFIK